ncbi:MAG TPA: VOC family protein [Burkholderiales bacterium]|nr:VOC family protein [Burkholderiales bacterium]
MKPFERQRPPPGELVLDHAAHFVQDLEAAAELLRKLGFAPTPVSNHQVSGQPAGTANRCVMLGEGYLEILAPTLDTPNADRVRNYMKRYGGVHLVCFGTPAAEAEHARLGAHGFEPEPLVDLQRKTEAGEPVRFKVVYVPPGKMPEGRIQYCEHLTAKVIWNDQALAHSNGVKGLAAAYVVADDPVATAARWARFSGLLPSPRDGLVQLETGRGRIFLGDRTALSAFIENVPPAPGVAALELAFEDPSSFAARCAKAGLKVKQSLKHRHCVTFPHALGGTWLF